MGGDRFAVVLEFESLSRIIASMQTMKSWRCVSARPARLSSKLFVAGWMRPRQRLSFAHRCAARAASSNEVLS
jgi:hypothetical protein